MGKNRLFIFIAMLAIIALNHSDAQSADFGHTSKKGRSGLVLSPAPYWGGYYPFLYPYFAHRYYPRSRKSTYTYQPQRAIDKKGKRYWNTYNATNDHITINPVGEAPVTVPPHSSANIYRKNNFGFRLSDKYSSRYYTTKWHYIRIYRNNFGELNVEFF